MDRELYDLCRRYNYFYRKYRDIKELSYKYHDERLKKVVVGLECDLKMHEANLIDCIFRKLDLDKCYIEIESSEEIPCHGMIRGICHGGCTNEIKIKNNEKFRDALLRIQKHYMWW
jgi:hypothetical protein